MPYARASRVLALLLPVDTGNSTFALRNRTLAVGKRIEAEVKESNDEPKPKRYKHQGSLTAIGLDSGFVRDCTPRSERSFEVVVGRILGKNGSSRSLGFVRKIENSQQAWQRIRYPLHHRVSLELGLKSLKWSLWRGQ